MSVARGVINTAIYKAVRVLYVAPKSLDFSKIKNTKKKNSSFVTFNRKNRYAAHNRGIKRKREDAKRKIEMECDVVRKSWLFSFLSRQYNAMKIKSNKKKWKKTKKIGKRRDTEELIAIQVGECHENRDGL